MTAATGLPWPETTRRLRIGDLEVDLWYRRLTSPEQEVELPQRVFDLLLVFLAQPHVVHGRAALFEQVWSGVVVDDANLSQSIWVLRKALGEPRRRWIRTVARTGYVFEPAAPVEVMPEPAPAAPASVPSATPGLALEADGGACGVDGQAPAATAEAVEPRPGPDPARHAARDAGHTDSHGAAHPATPIPGSGTAASRPVARRRAVAVAAAVVALVATLVLVTWNSRQEPAADPPATAIALINLGNQHDAEARWPATLLYAWLEWKLQALPELEVLGEAHLAADAATSSATVVLLTSGMAAGGTDERFVRARITDAHGTRQHELRGRPGQIPGLVDALSRQVLDELVPRRAAQPWPALQIDQATARRYATAYEAYRQRDLSGSATGLQAVTASAPDFGLAQLQLALSLSRLGQAGGAMIHMQQAQALLTPVPGDAQQVLHATALSVDPQRTAETAAAFTALAQQYPHNPGFRIDRAWHQLRSGQPEAAMASLSQVDWQRQPVGVRIPWLLLVAEIRGVQGDLEAAREYAAQAAGLAAEAGDGWLREQARGIQLKAQADAMQYGAKADLAQFEQAARLFDTAGAHLDALYARVSAELASTQPGPSAQLDTLLAQARAGGYRAMEVRLLRQAAFRHYNAGELDEYRRRLEDALAAAVAAGDTVGQQAVELDLLNEDVLAGRLRDARSRIRRIHRVANADADAAWLDEYEAFILVTEGDYAGALKALDNTAQRLARNGRPPLPDAVAVRVACARVDKLLSLGELQQARMELDRCRTATHPQSHSQALVLGASVNLLAGDAASALAALRQVHQDLQAMADAPDRWLLSLQAAQLLARAGRTADAEALYLATLKALEGTQYAWLMADAETGLAEIAVVRGHWRAAARHAANARRHLAGQPWSQRQRLDRVSVLVALGTGAPETANALLAGIHDRAHALGDVATQLELHSLVPGHGRLGVCDAASRSALVASTGMRGANLDWMKVSVPETALPALAGATAPVPLTARGGVIR